MKRLLLKIWRLLPFKIRSDFHDFVRKITYRRKFGNYAKTVDLDNIPIFKSVEIETVNRCNGKGNFCPVNVNEKQRDYAKMTGDLYLKIIEDLKNINYNGHLALFSNNEPFLDSRIIEWNKIARENLPNAYIYLYTNGSLLTKEKVVDVMQYMDELVIDNYDGGEEQEKLFGEIESWGKRNNKIITVFKRSTDEVLTSRGGQSPNKKRVRSLKGGCFYPFQQLVIRPNGKVSLCCNDALGVYTMGDCNKQTLNEIWNSESYREVRRSLMKNGRVGLKLCDRCDTRNYIFESMQ